MPLDSFEVQPGKTLANLLYVCYYVTLLPFPPTSGSSKKLSLVLTEMISGLLLEIFQEKGRAEVILQKNTICYVVCLCMTINILLYLYLLYSEQYFKQ